MSPSQTIAQSRKTSHGSVRCRRTMAAIGSAEVGDAEAEDAEAAIDSSTGVREQRRSVPIPTERTERDGE